MNDLDNLKKVFQPILLKRGWLQAWVLKKNGNIYLFVDTMEISAADLLLVGSELESACRQEVEICNYNHLSPSSQDQVRRDGLGILSPSVSLSPVV